MKASAHIIEVDGECRLRWNHNSAYYPELVSDAALRGGVALDVGCGDGALLELLAGVCRHVVGVEADPATARTAAGRVAGSGTVICGDFMAAQDFAPEEFDTITCVASAPHADRDGARSDGGAAAARRQAARRRTVSEQDHCRLAALRSHGRPREGVRMAPPRGYLPGDEGCPAL